MKATTRSVILFGICIIWSLLLVMSLPGPLPAGDKEQPAGTPKIQFAELSHDFGVANQNSELRHTFTFKNTGTGVLRIENVRTSCGCTAALVSEKEIAPGGEGRIEVVFKTGSFAGKNEKTITVTSNDPEHPTTTLKIAAEVQVVLDAAPNRIMFGQVKKNEQAVRYAALTGSQKDKARITTVDVRNEHLKVDVDLKGFENDPGKQIRVTLLPGMQIGRFNERVVLHTTHDRIKEVPLYVMGEVTGNIAVMPNFLHFGMFEPGAQVERVLTVRAAGETAFQVTGVTSNVPDIVTVLETVQAGREYRIRARLREGFSGDMIRGQLTITTDDKDQGTIPVNVFGRKATKPHTADLPRKP